MTVVPIRKGLTLGGSEIPAVLGLDPYTSPYALACRKLGLTSEPEASRAATMGLRLQSAHLTLLEDDGYTVIPAPESGFQHRELPWLVGHPDAFALVDGNRAPVELKLRGVVGSDAVRDATTVQALVYAELVDAPAALVSELHGGYGGIVRDEWLVARDPELFAVIVERCEAFLATVKRGKCPAPDGSDASHDALRARWSGDPGLKMRLSAAGMEHLRRVRELDETIRAAKAQRERYAQLVQDEMGDATEAISPTDYLAARWGVVTRTALDTAAIKRDLPHVAAEYSKTTTTRRFEANP